MRGFTASTRTKYSNIVKLLHVVSETAGLKKRVRFDPWKGSAAAEQSRIKQPQCKTASVARAVQTDTLFRGNLFVAS